MAGRYIKPAELPPDPALVDLYLRRAHPRYDELGAKFEAERVAAHGALLVIYRAQLEQGPVDPQLRLFFHSVSRRIWMAADPLRAMTEFLRGKPQRGAKQKNEDRDFFIAVDVAEKVEEGQSVDAACKAVAQQVSLSFDHIRKIYFAQGQSDRHKLEIAAELSMRKLERKPSDGTTAG